MPPFLLFTEDDMLGDLFPWKCRPQNLETHSVQELNMF